MQIELKIDPSCTEPKVVISASAMTDEVRDLLERLSQDAPSVISGSRDGRLEVLEQADLIRIYASAGKVFAVTDRGEYALRLRLYEAENRLDSRRFVRISNSEIINLKKVDHFDLSFAGTICVTLKDNTTTYVSRRFVSKIKKKIGI